jgi:hypothetical protein
MTENLFISMPGGQKQGWPGVALHTMIPGKHQRVKKIRNNGTFFLAVLLPPLILAACKHCLYVIDLACKVIEGAQ